MPSLNSPAIASAMGPVKKNKASGYVGSKFVGNSASAPGQIKKAAPIAKTLPTIGGPTITDRMATPQMPMKNPISSLVGGMQGGSPQISQPAVMPRPVMEDRGQMPNIPGMAVMGGNPNIPPQGQTMQQGPMSRTLPAGALGAAMQGGIQGGAGLQNYLANKNRMMQNQQMAGAAPGIANRMEAPMGFGGGFTQGNF